MIRKMLPLLPLSLLFSCQSVSIEQEYLMRLVNGDLSNALDLYCANSSDLRIEDLQQATDWKLVSSDDQEFDGIKLQSHVYQVTNQLGKTDNYNILVAQAKDIEALIQYNNKTFGYTDVYDPQSYKQRGQCIAATAKMD